MQAHEGAPSGRMPNEREAFRKAEKEIGKNIPEGMKGLDTEDVGDVNGSKPRRRAEGADEARS